jgi:asparagine synthase (glutamine-hydrolysing)
MSGIFGFISERPEERCTHLLDRMAAFLANPGFLSPDALYAAGGFYASRYFPSYEKDSAQPLELSDRWLCWFTGEIYSPSDSPVDAFHAVAKGQSPTAALPAIEGKFVCVFFDRVCNTVHLACDRFGVGNLYWWVQDGGFYWSTEIKAYLACTAHPAVDRRAVEDFLAIGYFLSDETWFPGVRRLPPATILSFEVDTQRISVSRYWNWDDSCDINDSPSLDTLAGSLAEHFEAAVALRSRRDRRLGVHLSGGLDSRAILAAMPGEVDDIHAVTFGTKRCPDVSIARRVAALKGVKHSVFEITQANWLARRLKSIWEVDGLVSVIDMHSAPFLGEFSRVFDVNLSGAGGGGVFGGGHLFELSDGDQVEKYARKIGLDAVVYPTGLSRFQECVASYPDAHALYVDHRIHRFTGASAQLARRYGIEWRLPFLGNSLQEFVYRIPAEVRRDGRLYALMLLQRFPDYFSNIPWQSTGRPISSQSVSPSVSSSPLVIESLKLLHRVLNRITGARPRAFAPYPKWLGAQKPFLRALLLDERESLLQSFVDSAQIARDVGSDFARGYTATRIGRYITAEVWLRQVKEEGAWPVEEFFYDTVR